MRHRQKKKQLTEKQIKRNYPDYSAENSEKKENYLKDMLRNYNECFVRVSEEERENVLEAISKKKST